MPDIPLGDRPEKFGRLYLSLQFGDPLEEFGELLEGEYYFKIRRIMGIMVGICNGVKTYCHWKDDELVRYIALESS
jgi:hypothetical protein